MCSEFWSRFERLWPVKKDENASAWEKALWCLNRCRRQRYDVLDVLFLFSLLKYHTTEANHVFKHTHTHTPQFVTTGQYKPVFIWHHCFPFLFSAVYVLMHNNVWVCPVEKNNVLVSHRCSVFLYRTKCIFGLKQMIQQDLVRYYSEEVWSMTNLTCQNLDNMMEFVKLPEALWRSCHSLSWIPPTHHMDFPSVLNSPSYIRFVYYIPFPVFFVHTSLFVSKSSSWCFNLCINTSNSLYFILSAFY